MCPPEEPIGDTSLLTEEQTVILKDLIRRGMKISAIKEYRSWTGLGLLESKNAVERIEAEM